VVADVGKLGVVVTAHAVPLRQGRREAVRVQLRRPVHGAVAGQGVGGVTMPTSPLSMPWTMFAWPGAVSFAKRHSGQPFSVTCMMPPSLRMWFAATPKARSQPRWLHLRGAI
jgi:hypothetical protein